MTSTGDALWTFIERMIYKCAETEQKSQMFIAGEAEFEKCVHSGILDLNTETNIQGYVASTQRIGYVTGFIEGAKLMHLILSGSVNDINEMVLDILGDKISSTDSEKVEPSQEDE